MAQQGNQDKRGFASMSEEERREIARKGGQSVLASRLFLRHPNLHRPFCRRVPS
jgi:general stress protein YciG